MSDHLKEKIHKLLAFEKALDNFLFVLTIEKNGIIQFANQHFLEITHYTEADLIGKDYKVLNFSCEQVSFYNAINEVISQGITRQHEFQFNNKQGELICLDAVITPVYNDHNDFKEVLIFGLVNEKKNNPLNTEHFHERVQNIFGAISDMISITDKYGKRIFVNNQFCKFFGIKKEQANEVEYNFTDQKALQDYKTALRSLTPENPGLSNAHLLKNANNEPKWILWSETGLFDSNNELQEILSVGRDITEIKLNEAQLNNSLDELKILETLSRDAFKGTGKEEMVQNIIRVFDSVTNSLLTRFFNYKKDEQLFYLTHELKNDCIVKYDNSDYSIPLFKTELGKLNEEGRGISVFKNIEELINALKDLNNQNVSEHLRTIQQHYGNAIIISIPLLSGMEILGLVTLLLPESYDVDLKKLDRISKQCSAIFSKVKAEEEIAQQKLFHESILNKLPVNIGVFNLKGEYIFINESAIHDEELRDWIIGKTDFDYCRFRDYPLVIAEKRFKHLGKAAAGEISQYVEEINVKGNIRYFLRIVYPVKEKDDVKFLIGYGIEITDIKNAEKQKDEHIMQLENIAFTTSHKIRQPLVNMQGLVYLLEEHPDEGNLQNMIGLLKESVQQMDDLTRQLAKDLNDYKNRLNNYFVHS